MAQPTSTDPRRFEDAQHVRVAEAGQTQALERGAVLRTVAMATDAAG